MKEQRVATGELCQAMYEDYDAVVNLLIANLGRNRLVRHLHPDDFANLRNKTARNWGAVRLSNVI